MATAALLQNKVICGRRGYIANHNSDVTVESRTESTDNIQAIELSNDDGFKMSCKNLEDFGKLAVILMFPSPLPDVPFAFTKQTCCSTKLKEIQSTS
jgi:hypothetical protein